MWWGKEQANRLYLWNLATWAGFWALCDERRDVCALVSSVVTGKATAPTTQHAVRMRWGPCVTACYAVGWAVSQRFRLNSDWPRDFQHPQPCMLYSESSLPAEALELFCDASSSVSKPRPWGTLADAELVSWPALLLNRLADAAGLSEAAGQPRRPLSRVLRFR